MTAGWHVVAKLLTVSRMSKVDYQNKVLLYLWLNGSLWNQKWFFYGIAVNNLLSTFIFKSVQERAVLSATAAILVHYSSVK